MDGPNERKGYPVTAAGYELLEEIGQGVSATVYRALCLPVNEVVAIKSLDLEKCISNLDGIRREAQMMSLINHPNVVKAYCSFVVDQALWVVMPYMAGGSCLHIMKAAYSDGFEEPVIATVLKAALKALEYLHRHGHIHRDVKAGNILVDASGAVKLGDFGVSACMFDTGDRQRSRNTFVGTPCWMAPEVMEQLHGYDFKADIWSFGITGLELAHGHAPFSKYPPMKVLLMTLQNAPPGLDYERDKRFSKLFKEMIAMCLVKDPAKRPSAEKLLKHSFFKHARNCEYVARHVLDGLPSLGDRVKTLKLNDAVRLAQKKMLSGEWEERSQNEYKRGVSSWNFNVEDLKTRAAMIQDDHGTDSAAAKEESEASQVCDLRGEYESSKASRVRADVEDATPAASDTLPANLLLSDSRGLESSRTPTPAVLPNVVEAVSSVRSSRIPRSDSLASSPSAKRPDADHLISRSACIGKRDHKHGGRTSTRGSEFDAGSSADAHAIGKQNSSDEWQSSGRRDGGVEREGRDEKGEGISGESESRQAVRVKENSNRTQFRERATVSASVPCIGCSDASDERLRVGIIQKKGRFSITSEGVERDPAVEKEREHLQQIADLQNKVARLLEELQAVKSKNADLERQLSRTSVGERIQSG